MVSDLIKQRYDLAPSDPGVYLMKDIQGRIIYVGKAKNLKKRLASYFVRESGHDNKTTLLIKNIADFDIIITSTEHEALILEATLIKKHKPKYNIFLKDGKNYPCFRIDTTEDYPLLQVVRKIKNDGATYFGPYSSGHNIKTVLRQVNRIFKLRKCRDRNFQNRTRPCIQFQIKACLGPCCNKVPVEIYKKMVGDVALFLKGRSPDLVKRLKKEMAQEAENQEFEKAAYIRDTIFAIERSLEQQIAVSADLMDRDVVASVEKEGRAVVTLLFVRSGYVVGTEHHLFDVKLNLNVVDSDNLDTTTIKSATSKILEAFLKQYYQAGRFIPSQILTAENFEDKALLEEALSLAKGKKVNILVPERGEKRLIVDMAINNAQRELETSILKNNENSQILTTLQKSLGMENYPKRIECFDNSNIAGTDPVSSMVVFIDGELAKSLYRKFIIKSVKGHDDYAYMTEVLTRRFSIQSDANIGKNGDMDLPDLLVVDGGKGQLSMAMAVLSDLELKRPELKGKIKVIGLAKKDLEKGETHDKVYVWGRSNPINMTQSSQSIKALYLLQRLRDEAHRFAITFQRQRRAKRAELSILDGVEGVGKKRKAMLLAHFKGISAMKMATVEEIAALPGMSKSVAEKLKIALGE
ncbi:MAG: excinuclease ABC subunit UvrC [Desulfamplus sp.]|nr:excinuclease ABC subunit UvrC [Desulfamplus sp.]